jgi:dihydrofolate reductase
MRRLIEATFVSLDGVIESQEKWALPYFSGESKSEALAELASVDTFLLGRETYQKFAASWSQVKGDPYFDRVNGLRKLVASRTLASATWNAEIIKGNVAEEIARLKRQPGKEIIKYGTGELDRVLIEHNLIDEFRFSIFPVVVGRGRHLFEGIDLGNRKFELTEAKSFSNGVV